MRRVICFVALALATMVVVAGPASACGGLVGENGTIQLTRTTTLAAYHDGVERYVTSFEFSGTGESVGSIVPLPGIPTKVERGGDWTLQRLEREIAPPALERLSVAADAQSAAGAAEVLQQTQVDALDITILRGGGDEVGKWAIDHGFLLTPDAPEVLDFYSHRSKIFMAARFDAARAASLGQQSGDGTPIMLTIPTDEPWVPLRILALGLDSSQFVNADVFLLTDQRPNVLVADSGVETARSEPASASLLDDLRSDTHMGWVPDSMWFTYYNVSTPAGELRHDLAVSTHADTLPSARMAGFSVPASSGTAEDWWIPALLVVVPLVVVGVGLALLAAACVVSRVLRAHRLVSVTVIAVLVALGAGVVVLASAGASSPPTTDGVLGPGRVTVRIDVDHSHFRTAPIRVRPHTEVRFVVVNHDPIGHELIVGGPDVQARHASGHEAYHPPVSGEVSVPAEGRAATTYFFHAPGPVEYACHLPRHYEYGMHGIVEVVADEPA